MKSLRPGLTAPLSAFLTLFCLSIHQFATAQWTTGTNISNTNTGNVGIGTSTPNAKLEVDGNLLLLPPSTGQMYIVNGITIDNTKSGIRCNSGGIVFNSANNGKLFLNRDTYSDTWIESSPDGVNNIEIATFKANGNVGIGTTTPRTTLDLNGSFYLTRPAAMVDAQSTIGIPTGSLLGIAPSNLSASNPGYVTFLFPDNNSFRIGTNYDGHLGSPFYQDIQFGRYVGDAYMTIKDGGNILIGKTSQTNTSYKLDVNGTARINKVVVNSSGADFVFDRGYHLPTLPELERYVRREHHLPGISPAAGMQKDGVDIGDNQTKLLAKVEELTLYMIDKDKEVTALKERITQLEQRNKTLENLEQRIQRLEQGNTGQLTK